MAQTFWNCERCGEPLPCPFCGGEAELVTLDSRDSYVKCGNEACLMGPVGNLSNAKGEEGQAEAIAAWNHRAPTAPIRTPWTTNKEEGNSASEDFDVGVSHPIHPAPEHPAIQPAPAATSKNLVEDIAKFVSEGWHEPDIARGIRMEFQGRAPEHPAIMTAKELANRVAAGEKWKLAGDEHPAIIGIDFATDHLAEVRAQALEEAAKVCHAYAVKWRDLKMDGGYHTAAGINLATEILDLVGQITPKAEQS